LNGGAGWMGGGLGGERGGGLGGRGVGGWGGEGCGGGGLGSIYFIYRESFFLYHGYSNTPPRYYL
jgi:hypothetical protein